MRSRFMGTTGMRIVLAIVLSSALAVGVAWPAPQPAQADDTASVFIDPLEQTIDVGATTTVSIKVDAVTDLYGAEFHLTFNTDLLEVVDADPYTAGVQIAPGPFLPTTWPDTPPEGWEGDWPPTIWDEDAEAYVTYDPVDITINRVENGTIEFVFTLLNPAEPLSGGGVVANIAFHCKDEGTSILAWQNPVPGEDPVKLADDQANPISVTIAGATITNEIPPPEISDIKVTDVSDVAFVVSWVTNIEVTGQVEYSETIAGLEAGGTVVDDLRGAGVEDDTHYVIISGLDPEKTYYFDVISGTARDDNNGNHYTVTTGPTIGPPPHFYTVFGKAVKYDGTTPAEGAIIYISVVDNDGEGSLGTSQEMSALVDANGDWSKVLGTIREADLSDWFEFDRTGGGDNLSLVAQGAADGTASLTVTTTSSPRDAGTLTLVPNLPPIVDNVVASQRAGTGIVDISYDVKEQDEEDTSVTISFEYWNGVSYVPCTTVTGVGSKDVTLEFASYTGTWDAKADFDGQYMTDAKIKVIADDGKILGIGEGISSDFTLDTKAPTDVACSSPPNEATDVDLRPTLTASTATDPSTPLSYYFTIAEDIDFTTGVQNSGWLGADITTWVPPTMLSPDTDYWWKVKAKDSFGNESDYSTAFKFHTVTKILVEKEIVAGLNLFALEAEPDPPYTAASLLEEINNQGGNATEIYSWNEAYGWFDAYILGLPLPDFPIEVGRGYFIISSVKSTFTYMGYPLTAPPPEPVPPKVTDVSDVAFVVSWTTQSAVSGQVEYSDDPADLPGGGTTVEDTRGADFTGTTHYVIVGGLTPEATYYFDVISGGVRDDNNGNHYTVTLGPTLGPPPHYYTVLGKVLKSDGTTPAEGTIVYISVVDNDGTGSSGTSQEMSALVDANGDWNKVLGTIREADLSAWFTFDTTDGGDNLSLVAQGAADGTASLTVTTTSSPRDAGTMTLGLVVEKEIVAGLNLIALPIEPATPYTAKSLLEEINEQGGNATEIYSWNEAYGWFDAYILGLPLTPFSIEMGRGYFIISGVKSIWSIQSA